MMGHRTTQTLLALTGIIVAALFMAPTLRAGASEHCMSDWAKAAAIVKQHRMIDVDGLSELARTRFKGQIMTARLCKSDSSYFYRLVIRRSDGSVKRAKIDALNPKK